MTMLVMAFLFTISGEYMAKKNTCTKSRTKLRQYHKWPMNYWPKGAIRLLRKHRWAEGCL